MSDKQANGHLTLKTFFIILGISVTILIAIFGVINNNTQAISNDLSDVRKEVSSQAQRLSTSEANVENITQRLDKFDSKLDQILFKLK